MTPLVAAWLVYQCVLVLSLVGCSTLGRDIVVINESAEARLEIVVKRGLFTTMARIGPMEAGPFIVDTGADHLYLDSELAKRLNPSSWGDRESRRSHPHIKWGVLAAFDVGRMALHNTVVGVTDLSAASGPFGERLAGLLGYPLFARTVVEVDYRKESISCFDPKTYRLPTGHWQPLTLIGNLPTITARLEGNVEGPFVLDTGNTSTVLLFPEFVRKHSLLANREVRVVKHVSMAGEGEMLAGRIAWFEFAGQRFEKPVVQFDLSDKPRRAPPQLAGVIGRGFLREFIVVFHYPESKIAFLPN